MCLYLGILLGDTLHYSYFFLFSSQVCSYCAALLLLCTVIFVIAFWLEL